ncbi:hypothetical protein [Kitasatospora sp. MBT63]|uniref:hypothetical protein n=1 Tax=Kitasatospora sp. MBT63 TaxID=1444768 RepID=UPI0011EA68C0|nr:hypothetical protein [Kitasatospora sp. MBT63]
MPKPPSWYYDGRLVLERQRLAQANAVVTRATDEIPLGDPATDQLHTARYAAWLAELQLAQRVMEFHGTGGTGGEGGFRPGDLVLDGEGGLYVRASAEDEERGWPWAYASDSGVPLESEQPNEGTLGEDHPKRPLTLLVRSGRPVGGVPMCQ